MSDVLYYNLLALHHLKSTVKKLVVILKIFSLSSLEEKVMNIKPWEIIPLEENGVMKYVIRYYKTYNAEGNEVIKIDFYDDKFVTEYVYGYGTTSNETSLKVISKKEHLFKYCPVISFENNGFHKVVTCSPWQIEFVDTKAYLALLLFIYLAPSINQQAI